MRNCAIAIVLVAILFLAVPVNAQVETRCGLSTGFTAGATIPLDPEVHNEFDYLIRLELNAKYYLFWGVSIDGGVGYQYGQGSPERIFLDDNWVDLDMPGTSFWRAAPIFGTLRVEFWRLGLFNPYVGGGGGVTFLTIERKGYELNQPVSNGGQIWAPQYFGMAGLDIAMGKYWAIRFEGKYRFLPTNQEFFDNRDFGGLDIMGGINIYF